MVGDNEVLRRFFEFGSDLQYGGGGWRGLMYLFKMTILI